MKPSLSEDVRRWASPFREAVLRLEKAAPEGFAFAFLEDLRGASASVHRSESAQGQFDRGWVLRLCVDGRNLEAAGDALSDEALSTGVESLLERRAAHPRPAPVKIPPRALPWDEEDLSSLPPETRRALEGFSFRENDLAVFAPEIVEGVDGFTPGDALTRARELRERALAFERGWLERNGGGERLPFLQATVRVRTIRHLYVDRFRMMAQVLPLCIASVTGQGPGGKSMRSLVGGLGGLERLRMREEDLHDAVVLPRRLETAERLVPGRYRIITGPDVTGVVAHEAFGHTQEGDTIRQGRSVSPALRAAGPVGNPLATIVNDPPLFEMDGDEGAPNGSFFFDHEGCLARRQVLLDRGVLSDPMTDRLSAAALGVATTGNGKRESWRRPTLTRQTNTYFTPGSHSFAELVAMVPRGFLARWSHGGMEDPKGARLTAGSEYLEEIVDGRLTGRLFVGPSGGHVELSGLVPELLSGILGKSRNEGEKEAPHTLSGGCGKFHKEFVMAGCGGTWILWSEMTCG